MAACVTGASAAIVLTQLSLNIQVTAPEVLNGEAISLHKQFLHIEVLMQSIADSSAVSHILEWGVYSLAVYIHMVQDH